MLTKYILAALATVFMVLAFTRMASREAKGHPQARAWLLIGVIFTAVSAWLFYQE
jgi:hypothetical protein